MTFIAPAQTPGARLPTFMFGRRAAKPRGRLRIADEDVARRAFGAEVGAMGTASSGPSIEHLARIALG